MPCEPYSRIKLAQSVLVDFSSQSQRYLPSPHTERICRDIVNTLKGWAKYKYHDHKSPGKGRVNPRHDLPTRRHDLPTRRYGHFRGVNKQIFRRNEIPGQSTFPPKPLSVPSSCTRDLFSGVAVREGLTTTREMIERLLRQDSDYSM